MPKDKASASTVIGSDNAASHACTRVSLMKSVSAKPSPRGTPGRRAQPSVPTGAEYPQGGPARAPRIVL